MMDLASWHQGKMKILILWRSHIYGPTAVTLWGLSIMEWTLLGCSYHSRGLYIMFPPLKMITTANLLQPPCRNSELETLLNHWCPSPCQIHKFCIDSIRLKLNNRVSITRSWCHKWMMYQALSCNCLRLKLRLPSIWEAPSGHLQATQSQSYICLRHLQGLSQCKEWWVEVKAMALWARVT